MHANIYPKLHYFIIKFDIPLTRNKNPFLRLIVFFIEINWMLIVKNKENIFSSYSLVHKSNLSLYLYWLSPLLNMISVLFHQ